MLSVFLLAGTDSIFGYRSLLQLNFSPTRYF